MRDREHSNLRVRFPWACLPAIACLLAPIPGCSTPPRAPAAASNDDFSTGAVRAGLPSEVDDRWASIVLDDAGNAEVRTILVEAAEGSGEVEPLVPAPHGVRFEDVPHAMLNAAPKVEMAILRSRLLPPTIDLDIRDAAGRAATVTVRCRPRGTLASMTYRIPGDDAMLAQAEILAAVNGIVLRPEASTDPEQLANPLTHALAELGATIQGQQILPERYRYTLLMLDEEEATIEIRREPAPTMVSWTATAGTFGRPAIAQRLGETFMECLRAWGEVPRMDRAAASADE